MPVAHAAIHGNRLDPRYLLFLFFFLGIFGKVLGFIFTLAGYLFVGILGVVGMMTMPEFPVNNVIDAVAVGIASGLAATGAHQIGKQLTKD
ncbi:MAG: hypothetical protein II008_02010 [Oscillospiraceae bacterium]|nr:hypothetical protein [Oscillospiraceae bacterium]